MTDTAIKSGHGSAPRRDSNLKEKRRRPGRLVTAEGSGHDIHLERPDVVIEAIDAVISGAVAK